MRWPKEVWDKATECSIALTTETNPEKRARLAAERDGWIEVANRMTAAERASITGDRHAEQTARLH